MGGGLYSTEKRSADSKLDLTKIKPYGDYLNDGKIQLSFTLPLESNEKTFEAAKLLLKKMGLEEPSIVYHKKLDNGFTFFTAYGSSVHTIDYTTIQAQVVDFKTMTSSEINQTIKTTFNRKIVCLGATTGSDAHTVGIDAIMNRKGFAGHYGLESYEMIESVNLGSQVPNEEFVKKTIEIKADVLLVSQTVTQRNIHISNLTQLIELLEGEGIREKLLVICGGPRITNELVKELGYDAGFGPGTYADAVASFIVLELVKRKTNKNLGTHKRDL